MTGQGPHGGYPDDGPPGYPQQPYPAAPQTPYLSPGGYPMPGHHPHQRQARPVTAVPPPTVPQPEPAPRPRRALKILIPLCVVLALAFAGAAYFFHFSGDEPSEVVGQYITRAQDEDFAGAREYAAEDATQGIRFHGDSEGMEAMRRWFGEDSMSWEVREESTGGSTSTVIVDKSLILPDYDEPVDMRWDYRLTREAGSWKIEKAKIMPIVADGIAGPGDCMLSSGFAYEASDCSATSDGAGTSVVTVTDAVEGPDDCPNPAGPAVETTKRSVLCLEEQNVGTG